MKRFMILALVSMAASASYAASEKCRAELMASAAQFSNGRYLLNQEGGVPAIKDCKNVELSNPRIDNKVYITEDRTTLIIENQIEKKISFSLIPGKITDYAVMAGRLIISTDDKTVLIVGRNGNIFEMLSSSGKSYKDVKGIAIDNQVLVIEQFSNQPIRLTEQQVTDRVNEQGKFRAVSF